MLPSEPAVQPDPVTVTTVPPFRQVAGATVMLGGPAMVLFAALQGTVVVVVVGAVVVVVVACVVVVVVAPPLVVVVVVPPPPPDVVVVVVPPPPPANEIEGGDAAVPSEVPNSITQESPAVTWAGVGGHGYLAASVAASFPALSVPAVGGPTVPSWTVKLADRVPVAVVVSMALNGLEHETGAAFPATTTVG